MTTQPTTPAMLDFEALSRNAGQFMEQLGRAAARYVAPEDGLPVQPKPPQEASELVRTLGTVAETWLSDPKRTLEAQAKLSEAFVALWGTTWMRLQGQEAEPVAQPEPKDARFADAEWSSNPYFDFIKQGYLITTRWAEGLVNEAEGIDEHTRHKAQFYLRQLAGALSPSNFVMTNPELIRHTLQENGANLVRGMKMLQEDIEAGAGELRVRQTDRNAFEFGVDVAVTPGEVVFRNDLMELIQYAPRTETVLKRPFLIVPPWINKFYILDLNPAKSLIGWMVDQGLTVFVISWVNPDERHRDKDFESYMREGIEAAIDAIGVATGETEVAAAGYCVGGTLLSVTLAMQAATGNKRIKSATLLTTQVDFTHAGDLKVFADEGQIRQIETQMAERGYLDGAKMANAFNMLRPNDLIWSYVVNNYVKGKPPSAFDLLYWNADATRMPAANHAFYLRNCYLENNLAQGRMVLGNIRLDLKKVTVPVFNLATREDHIAPAISVFEGSSKFGGPVDYVLAGSGHIAGVVNPPSKPKYGYWTGGKAEGRLEDWLGAATETKGSWWPYWFKWLEAQAPERVPARKPGGDALPSLAPAPGTYVRMKA
ncbi:class I poly(R)-hydroxyalkanoic acid synthase [Methylobacterium sp. WL30]|uniref:PHA/PHB synthase family protein n=2 Tax=Methylobacterium TaxID=407 RepID=UPI0011C9E367|nr:MULTISPECIES: class I poly(R)-hydroxyalkanoic acid synthase [unclassified Methylobacterium]TXN30812.1 class I poly(R)-hydroxyalkanoic acid synthase [Methylobacterium sp. WL93]TXN50482.1 class I poly(R)-hydroxyalkanoic acid synthase [Methylobacterium sp. WL119]TXN65620.1 class I poly(R)-hydroxyalkanoic acid synthase [Methylobacterium sp. WL30]